MEGRAKSDIFNVVSNFFEENQLSSESLVEVCTDGDPAVVNLRYGFIQRAKERNPFIVGTYYVLHREALAFRICLLK